MLTQLPSVPSLIPSSFATRAIGRDVSITIFTASSLNSGEKIFFGRGNYFTFPDGPSYWMNCPEGSGQLNLRLWFARGQDVGALLPVLQTYMGHSSLADTAYYLHLTAESYPDITARVQQAIADVVPPVMAGPRHGH